MNNLDDLVSEIVKQFVKDGLLFTGLDVSNKVKETLPFTRHSEVAELVRKLFVSEMEPCGYTKTPITVSLKDGSTRTAMLYHLVSNMWDIDTKYDAQKRSQTATKPAVPVAATVAADGTITVNSKNPVILSTPSVSTTVQPKDLWANMFAAQPSLFPKR